MVFKPTHGMTDTPTYRSWVSMRNRCYDPKSKKWHLYGGKGVEVCARWRHSFENFFEDLGERPEGCTLDRIKSTGNYEPGNCRWATLKEQARAKVTWLTYDGRTQSLRDWSREMGFKSNSTISNRLRKGWSVERALGTPRMHA